MVLEVRNLSGGYGDKDICQSVSCHLQKGEILGVLGPNGCGKTTFFRLLLGLLKPSAGTVLIDGVDSESMSRKELSQKIAYIPQYHTPAFAYTVLEVVLMSRASYISAFSAPSEEDIEKAWEALKQLKIEHLAHKSYTALSGGQRQLVLIARAICQEANILVMDEPGSSLDYANHQLLMETISDLAQQGYSIVLSTHSPEHPFSVAQKVLLMKDGQCIAFGETMEVVTSPILKEVYGIDMDVLMVQDRNGKKRTLCLPVQV